VDWAIRDAGSGILDQDLPRIFEPFFSKRRGGTGLGLAIAQRIMENMEETHCREQTGYWSLHGSSIPNFMGRPINGKKQGVALMTNPRSFHPRPEQQGYEIQEADSAEDAQHLFEPHV
jgi:hypothetical protein